MREAQKQSAASDISKALARCISDLHPMIQSRYGLQPSAVNSVFAQSLLANAGTLLGVACGATRESGCQLSRELTDVANKFIEIWNLENGQ
jgi:hypothetical protein